MMKWLLSLSYTSCNVDVAHKKSMCIHIDCICITALDTSMHDITDLVFDISYITYLGSENLAY
jgi:hypothetical protein